MKSKKEYYMKDVFKRLELQNQDWTTKAIIETNKDSYLLGYNAGFFSGLIVCFIITALLIALIEVII